MTRYFRSRQTMAPFPPITLLPGVNSPGWRFDNSYAPVALADRTLRVQCVSPSFGAILRYQAPCLVGAALQDIIHSDDWAAMLAVLCHLRLGRRDGRVVDVRYLDRTRHVVRCETLVGALDRMDGAVTNYLLVLQPIVVKQDIPPKAA